MTRGAYRLSDEVQDLASKEFLAMHGVKNCSTCGSAMIEAINPSNFGNGECGACEYGRYKSQPALMEECKTQLENWQALLDGEATKGSRVRCKVCRTFSTKPMESSNEGMNHERSVNDMMIAAALGYLNMGFRPIPLIPGTKRSGIKWATYRARPPTEMEIQSWFGSGLRNIALITGNGVAVVDVDDRVMASTVIEHCGFTPMRCRTPGGMHLYYSDPEGGLSTAVRVNGMPIDIRSDGAYAVCPWSRNGAGVSYEWVDGIVPAANLPPIDVSWLRTLLPKRVVTPTIATRDDATMVRRARGYLAHVEGAIAGQRGHDRTFRVACVLTIKFGLTVEQAWPLINEWNEQCEPPWSEKELLHKLHDAFKLRVF